MPAEPSRVESLFERAIEHADPFAFAEAQCRDDPQLLARLNALLYRHADLGQFLAGRGDDLTPSPARLLTRAITAPDAGRVLAGRYHLQYLIGRGGSGTVYRAEQLEPVRRFVAVKLLRAEVIDAETRARFGGEAQTLARLDHPNIARVHDAGTDTDGRPFVVLELIDGPNLTTHCRGGRLGPRACVELFEPVARAVQHAHVNGVIHRDLKPSNILVTTADGRAVPKVIDFGIAKALTADAAETRDGVLLGTPAYMAPEQAKFASAAADARTDVYALGAVLYELLTGVPAFGATGDVFEILRAIREREPAAPSSLVKGLPRDLDWVVLRCLEKDPERRYQSAGALADDLAAFLANQPVSAGPPGWRYRAGKFVRRNRGAVAAATLVLAAVVAGLVGTSWGLVRANAEIAEQQRLRQIADAARAHAEAESRLVQTIDRFLVEDLFGVAPIDGGGAVPLTGDNPTLKDLLNRGRSAVDARLGGQPREAARVHWVLGECCYKAGDYAAAVAELTTARQLYATHYPPSEPVHFRAARTLARALRREGRSHDAAALLRDGTADARRILGAEHPQALATAADWAAALDGLGRFADARPILDEIVPVAVRHLPADDDTRLTVEFTHASNLLKCKRLTEARVALSDVHARQVAKYGPDHSTTLNTLAHFALLSQQEGDPAAAAAQYADLIARQEKLVGRDHPDTFDARFSRARILWSMDRHDEARNELDQLVAAQLRALPATSPATVVSRSTLALWESDRGNWARAAELDLAALRSSEGWFAKDAPTRAELLSRLGRALVRAGRGAEAEPLLREALRIYGLGPASARSADAAAALGEVLMGRDDAEAERLLLAGHAGMANDKSRYMTARKAESRAALAKLYRATGRPDEAAKWDGDPPTP